MRNAGENGVRLGIGATKLRIDLVQIDAVSDVERGLDRLGALRRRTAITRPRATLARFSSDPPNSSLRRLTSGDKNALAK